MAWWRQGGRGWGVVQPEQRGKGERSLVFDGVRRISSNLQPPRPRTVHLNYARPSTISKPQASLAARPRHALLKEWPLAGEPLKSTPARWVPCTSAQHALLPAPPTSVASHNDDVILLSTCSRAAKRRGQGGHRVSRRSV